jgi:hypothetical protein
MSADGKQRQHAEEGGVEVEIMDEKRKEEGAHELPRFYIAISLL